MIIKIRKYYMRERDKTILLRSNEKINKIFYNR